MIALRSIASEMHLNNQETEEFIQFIKDCPDIEVSASNGGMLFGPMLPSIDPNYKEKAKQIYNAYLESQNKS